MCQIDLYAGLFGTFCFSKGKRSFCLSLLKLQNVPNKPVCRLIWHIRVCTVMPEGEKIGAASSKG